MIVACIVLIPLLIAPGLLGMLSIPECCLNRLDIRRFPKSGQVGHVSSDVLMAGSGASNVLPGGD